jgi:hypothetical protein
MALAETGGASMAGISYLLALPFGGTAFLFKPADGGMSAAT